MKALLLASVLLATPVYADGLTTVYDDPVVTPPANTMTWTGFYAGAKAARTSTSTSSESCRKVLDGVDYGSYACDDPIFDYYPSSKVIDTETSSSSSTKGAAFAGYRHDFDPLVLGIEASSDPTIELQAGVGLGRVLIYGVAGTGEDDEFYGAGVDALLGNRLLLGVKHTTAETSLRIGIKF